MEKALELISELQTSDNIEKLNKALKFINTITKSKYSYIIFKNDCFLCFPKESSDILTSRNIDDYLKIYTAIYKEDVVGVCLNGSINNLFFPIRDKKEIIGLLIVYDVKENEKYNNVIKSLCKTFSLVLNNSKINDLKEEIYLDNKIFNILALKSKYVLYIDSISLDTHVLEILFDKATRLKTSIRYTVNYNGFLNNYSAFYLSGENADIFLANLSISNLIEKLNDSISLSFRFKGNDKKYYEVEAYKDLLKENRYLIAIRLVDDLVKEEIKNEAEKEEAIASIELRNEILSSIGSIYNSITSINLIDDTYEEIANSKVDFAFTGKRGVASVKYREYVDTRIKEEYKERCNEFFDLSTLNKRLKNENNIATEYINKDGTWMLARFIVRGRLLSGEVSHVLLTLRIVDATKIREQRLITIAEEANKANKAKSDFLSRMSHDLRTPINAITGFTSLALNDIESKDKIREDLHKIDRASNYLRNIIDDILDINRLESGKLKLNKDYFDINNVFNDVVELNKQTCGENVDFVYKISNIIHPYLLSDELHLKQIYNNLLSNAIKYTHSGFVEFEVYEEAMADNKVRLVSIIKDSGIGMSKEFIEVMYNSFTRAIDTRVNKIQGTGLGLSIVKAFVDLLDGEIEVDSTLNVGTCFKVIFEFSYKDEKEYETSTLSDISGLVHSLENCQILIAEDNDLNYEVESELLKLYGVICTRASNGLRCVEIFKENPNRFDYILMDMQMPIMDGIEATKKIRTLDNNIPIIALTANAFESDVKKCIAAGMDGHLAKPFDINKLLKVLLKFS